VAIVGDDVRKVSLFPIVVAVIATGAAAVVAAAPKVPPVAMARLTPTSLI